MAFLILLVTPVVVIEIMKKYNMKNETWITSLLKNGASPTFRYYVGIDFINYLEENIVHIIEENKEAASIIHSLIKYHDYRYIAMYLHAITINNRIALKIFEQISRTNDNKIKGNKLSFELAYTCFCSTVLEKKIPTILVVSSPDEIFNQSNQVIAIYFIDPSLDTSILNFINKVGEHFGTFTEKQFDIPGLNALVRQGVVRTLFMPDGKSVVAKQNNSKKPGRLSKELINYEAILLRMGGQNSLYLGTTLKKRNIWLKIAQPFAAIWDGYSNKHYTLSLRIDGISLEDLLMNEHDQATRCEYLVHCRLILDALFDKCILWGDMSPRNILVQQTKQHISYTIFDFEKTQVTNEPVPIEKRVEYCRGQVCAEEFGILCTPEEMQECFHGYFNPGGWNFESEEALPFFQRPEVADILNGRSIHEVTLGMYNRVDHEMMNARIPDIDPVTGQRRFPGHLNFKVEHYLGCAGYENAGDYERKTTEVLIAAKHYNCYDTIVVLLTEVTDVIEAAFLRAEFECILHNRPTHDGIPPRQVVEILTNTIDIFYKSRNHETTFRDLSTTWKCRSRESEQHNGII